MGLQVFDYALSVILKNCTILYFLNWHLKYLISSLFLVNKNKID